MKVLLINPSWPSAHGAARRHRRAWPPLDLLTTAALLRKNRHEVSVIDFRAGGIGWTEASALAEQADLILLQSTPLDRWQCPDLNWQYLVKTAAGLPKEKLVLAGAHGTMRPELFLSQIGCAALIRGEPEGPLSALAAAGGRPAGIRGLSYVDAGRFVHEPDQEPMDLDAWPSPAYDLIDLGRYRYELMGARLALLETSRGCPFSCTFCLKVMYGRTVRTKSPDRVLAETMEVVRRWKARNVYYMDLEFALHREKTLMLCRELKKLKLDFNWCCQTRVDSVDPDLLAGMKEAGCKLIHFGIETGSPGLLETTKKKISREQIGRAIQWCRKRGLATACFFLFGLPGETQTDRRVTMQLARDLNPTYASFHAAAPYPGAAMGRLIDDGAPFPICLGPEHDPEILARDIKKAFMSYYLRPRYFRDHIFYGGWPELLKKIRLFWDFVR